MNEKILNAVKQLKEGSKKRNFSQSFDLIISLKEFDVKKAENKFSDDVILPHGKGEESKVIIFGDNIKNVDAEIMGTEDLNSLSKNKRKAKNLAKEADFLLAEAKLMPVIGKVLGQFIGPKGKVPKVISGDTKSLVQNYKKAVRIRVKDAPVIQCPVGKENMKDEQVVENIEAVLKHLEEKLPKGRHNIKEILLKMTMSKPIKVEA